MIHKERSIGYSQNRTDIFLRAKSVQRDQKSRFDFGRRSISSSITQNPNESFDLNSSRDKNINLLDKNQEISIDIEMTQNKIKSQLPPEWVDVYDQIIEKIQEVRTIKKKVQELNKQRLKIQFGQNVQLEDKINCYIDDATRILKECEKQLFGLDKIKQQQPIENPEAEKRVLENAKKYLALSLQEITQELRDEQKALYNTLKKFSSANTNNEINKFSKLANLQEFALYEDMEKVKMEDDLEYDLAQERNAEINKLVDQINELANIFKQLSEVVIEQGTLLDRIDVNMEESGNNVKQSVKILQKALEHQKAGKCVRIVTFILILLIVICTVILGIRYSK